MVATHRAHRLAGATAVIAWCSAVLGCGMSSMNDMPVNPGAEITVKVVPSTVPVSTDTTADADLLAFQDGDGPWTSVTGTDGVYRFTVRDERYGVAVGCKGYFGGTALYYQLVSEASDLTVTGCERFDGTANITIDMQGVSPYDATEIWIGGVFLPVSIPVPAPLAIPKGVADVFARTYAPSISGDFAVRVYRGPTLDVQADQTLSIDMTTAVGVVTYPLTIRDPANVPGLWGVSSSLLTPHAHRFRWVQNLSDRQTGYSVVDASARQPGDILRVDVSETGATTDRNRLPLRSAFQEMATPSAVTLEPAAFLTVTDPSVDTRAVSQLSVTLPILPSALGHIASSAAFTTQDFAAIHYLQMYVRSGWAKGQSSVTLRAPDLRNLVEWSSDMALKARTEVDWSISVTDQNVPLDAPAGDGRRGTRSTVEGKVFPPQFATRTDAACPDERCDVPPGRLP